MSEERASDITVLGDGRVLIRDGDRQRLAYAVVDGSRTWIFLEGRTHVIDAAPPSPRRRGQDDQAALAAPMPASVLRVNVEPGQQVSAGDVLVVLEAMKMELTITAPRDARVKVVACRAGELVQPGVPLIELE